MSIANKEVCGRFHELFRTGNIEVAKATLADNFAWRTPAFAQAFNPPARGRGLLGIIEFAIALRTAFPDLHFVVTDTIAEDDRVVAAWHFQGTHHGSLAGMPATGKPVRVDGINTLRIRNGQVCEMWHNWGEMELLQQLDLMPALAPERIP